jgi:hypothetical protein
LLELSQAGANRLRGESGILVDPGDGGDARRVRLADEGAIRQARDDGEGNDESGHQGRRGAHRKRLMLTLHLGRRVSHASVRRRERDRDRDHSCSGM